MTDYKNFTLSTDADGIAPDLPRCNDGELEFGSQETRSFHGFLASKFDPVGTRVSRTHAVNETTEGGARCPQRAFERFLSC